MVKNLRGGTSGSWVGSCELTDVESFGGFPVAVVI